MTARLREVAHHASKGTLCRRGPNGRQILSIDTIVFRYKIVHSSMLLISELLLLSITLSQASYDATRAGPCTTFLPRIKPCRLVVVISHPIRILCDIHFYVPLVTLYSQPYPSLSAKFTFFVQRRNLRNFLRIHFRRSKIVVWTPVDASSVLLQFFDLLFVFDELFSEFAFHLGDFCNVLLVLLTHLKLLLLHSLLICLLQRLDLELIVRFDLVDLLLLCVAFL